MNAMILLRAMSSIDPCDIDAAYRAVSGEEAQPRIQLHRTGGHTDAAEPMLYPQSEAAGRRYAVGGWAAAAACIVLIIAAGLFFRSRDDFSVTQSDPGTVTEIVALTTAEPEQTLPTGGFMTLPVQTGAVTSAAVSAETTTQQTALPDENDSVPVESGTETTAVSEETATSAAAETALPSEVVQQTKVPAFYAVTDGSGSQFPYESFDAPLPKYEQPDGSFGWSWSQMTDDSPITMYKEPEWLTETSEQVGCVFETVHEEDAVRAYLEGRDDPRGQPAGELDNVLAAPEMVRVRWKLPDHSFDAYCIKDAEVTADGVLHLKMFMYTFGAVKEREPWVYELSLLYPAGKLPAVTDVELELEYHVEAKADTNSGAGANGFQWMPGGSELDQYIALWEKDVFILGPAV